MNTAVRVAAALMWLWPTGMVAQPNRAADAAPKVGEKAADFSLQSLDGATIHLSEEVARGPVVLTVLRGWPGYDCPFCTRQFADYLTNAERLETSGARVLFVYPGPSDGLSEHARAFSAGRTIPQVFRILLDPDYRFTNAYGLRWAFPRKPPTRRHSSSTRTAWSCSLTRAAVMAIAWPSMPS